MFSQVAPPSVSLLGGNGWLLWPDKVRRVPSRIVLAIETIPSKGETIACCWIRYVHLMDSDEIEVELFVWGVLLYGDWIHDQLIRETRGCHTARSTWSDLYRSCPLTPLACSLQF
jgi:hypothetical protein